jgi:hypothetical protein
MYYIGTLFTTYELLSHLEIYPMGKSNFILDYELF